MFDPSKLSEINIAGLPLSALLGALLTFLICVIVINVIMKLVAKALGGAKRLNHTMQRFLTSLVRALLWIIAIVIIAGELGIPTASLVALLSVAGLALSLSVQGVLGNIFAGLTLLMTHPFAEGNFVILFHPEEGWIIGVRGYDSMENIEGIARGLTVEPTGRTIHKKDFDSKYDFCDIYIG